MMVSKMKSSAEFEAFSALVGRVLSVPKEEILRRETEYKKESAKDPSRQGRGRKKTKSSASPDPAVA